MYEYKKGSSAQKTQNLYAFMIILGSSEIPISQAFLLSKLGFSYFR